MPLLLADFIYSRDCKLNLRKNVDTTTLFSEWKQMSDHFVTTFLFLRSKKEKVTLKLTY